ncbi:hypothetical protein [Secundilactobacillus kimchicus]|uniref:hypothetical protein n=1 Tax=Secundilactobacillus kimchicus TaxID=528209 RepID=UPI000B2BC7F7|nr:hypothetical protein [Secundilactobacillus kimchicus]
MATVISETVAGLLNLYYYIHHTTFPKIKISRQYLNYQSLIHVSTIGFPMGAEYSVSAIGAILMQNAINILGTDAIAAQSAGDKIRQFFYATNGKFRYGHRNLYGSKLRCPR